MILLKAFFPIFIVLFITLPVLGWYLGEKGKLGALTGALVGVILVTGMMVFLSREAYNPVSYIVISLVGLALGKKFEADKGIKYGTIIGLVIGIATAFLFNIPFSNYDFLVVWIGAVAYAVVLGKKYGAMMKVGKGTGAGIGITLDIVILLFVLLGFSAQ